MNILKIIEDHNLAIRKLPITRPAYRKIYSDSTNERQFLHYEHYDKPIKNAGCWLCGINTTHQPTMRWDVNTEWCYPDISLEHCLMKFIKNYYADNPQKQSEYLFTKQPSAHSQDTYS